MNPISTSSPFARQNDASSARDLTVGTLWRFLRGDHDAILSVASARGALRLGLLFVVSAALAREYDIHDLSSEPWRLLTPLAASLTTSFVLFSLLYVVARTGGSGRVPFLRTYRSFLALYWMTAPLAWLYAIPVERFLPEAGAVLANLALLVVVSTWRVLLMFRVAAAFCDVPRSAVVAPVLLFADVVALAAMAAAPTPVFGTMAGIWTRQGEWTGAAIGMLIGVAGVITLPVWLICTCVAARQRFPWQFGFCGASPSAHVSRGLWSLGVGPVLAFASVLPLTQPQRQLGHEVASLLYSGQIDAAVRVLTAHQPDDFPPHWDPPPHPHDATPQLLDVTDAILDAHAPTWVLSLFSGKIRGLLHSLSLIFPERTSDEEFERYARVLEAAPDGPALLWERRFHLHTTGGESEWRKHRLEQMRELAEEYGKTHGLNLLDW